ncbi:MAG: SBBP repeat-containing protein [Promethearchaeota archaeon]|nr:MAG: SBBP repeat-containing protein [Candidatus Lokiarchaeota archaeon]
MNKKKNRLTIVFLLVSLTSITIFSSILSTVSINQKINNQVNNKINFDELKYSLTEDWNVSWDKGDSEYGEGVALDENNGDIYVVGYNGTTNYDIILVKYNNYGEQQWNVTWDNGHNEFGYDIVLDSLGYIYVAGANGTTYPNFDALLLKFNSNGDLVWKRSYDGGLYDGLWALTIDSQNMIYVVGQTYTTSQAMLLLKYNNLGDLLWISTFDEPGTQSGYDIVLDTSNNIYVSGLNQTVSPQNDLLVVKFDPSGNHIWNRTWGGPDFDEAWGIALDSEENIYATGYTESYSATQKDFVVVKYDTNGNWLWNRTWGTNGPDNARGVAVDSADNIYIAGYTLSSNITLVKYDTMGNLIWYEHWERSPTYQHFCHDLLIDSSDKIYVVGRYWIISSYDLFLIKLSIDSPGGFDLSPPSGTIDNDGIFTLSWTNSPRANNYSIYEYSNYITHINSSLTIKANEIDSLSLPLSNYSDGVYYFRAVAFNNFGNSSSNCIYITVTIEESSTQQPIPGYDLIVISLIISIISVILVRKRLKSN